VNRESTGSNVSWFKTEVRGSKLETSSIFTGRRHSGLQLTSLSRKVLRSDLSKSLTFVPLLQSQDLKDICAVRLKNKWELMAISSMIWNALG
jgi:hypothetical protein